MKKSLENNSKYNEYDTDGDGVVSDDELTHVTEIKKLEHDLRKQRAQRRMATASLVAMGLFTGAMFFVDIERVKALADISNLFYISGAGIVGAYMGASAIMNRK
jgi:hypothetical protein|tara:strand:+ start:303 stop:614 length:312 start_codon:yes stop_codon:yes gene_type:complete